MEKLIRQYARHLRNERNVSPHTLRNYLSDLAQGATNGHSYYQPGGGFVTELDIFSGLGYGGPELIGK